MDTRLHSVERTVLLPADRPAGGHLALPLSGAKHERAASADAGAVDRWASVRVRAAGHAVDPGVLNRRDVGQPTGRYRSR